jgi:hypothetical protein
MLAPPASIRFGVAACLLLLSSAVCAQQPTAAEFYAIYTRALAIYRPAVMEAHPTPEQARLVTELPRVERELEATVRRLVGPFSAPKGFTGDGTWNGDFEPIAFEKGVSGILFGQSDPIWDHPYVLVSTMDLFRQWPSLPPGLHNDPEAIFRDGLMDAEVVLFNASESLMIGSLPIDKPPGVDAAYAVVGGASNGYPAVWPPQAISIYMRKGERIFIARLPPALEFPETVSCGIDLEAASRLFDTAAGRVLAKQCWEGGAKSIPASIAARKQAQQFLNDLAAP